MDAWAQIVVAVLALGGPLLAYLMAVRKTSGRIRSSDATELWEEARAIRAECAERVRLLETRNLELQSEIYRLQRMAAGDGH
jgi:hypothetical protein